MRMCVDRLILDSAVALHAAQYGNCGVMMKIGGGLKIGNDGLYLNFLFIRKKLKYL
jgi:hypothetical protein